MKDRRRAVLAAALLVVLLIVAYWRYGNHSFLAYRDDAYVTQNYLIRAGFVPGAIALSFRTYSTQLWHPIAWLSHSFDYLLFGLNPAGHHWMSILLHGCNAVLLFLVFRKLTGADAASFLLAALFAVHPLQVDTVAWVAQRKTIVAVFFALLSMEVYSTYGRRRGKLRWLGWIVLGSLAMLASPALITFPLILLLLDDWPLSRRHAGDRSSDSGPAVNPGVSWTRLVLEKLPLWLLSLIVGWQTLLAQEGNLSASDLVPFGQRLSLVVVGYVSYLLRALLPIRLAVEYPAIAIPSWQVWTSLILLLGITAGVVRWRQRMPALFVGWMWYVVALAPMSGIVQFAVWSTADRLTYWPMIGIYFAVSWIVATWAAPDSPRKLVATGIATLVLLSYVAVDWWRSPAWSSSKAFYENSLAMCPDNAAMHYRLGVLLGDSGDYEAALDHFKAATTLRPDALSTRMAVARSLIGIGKTREAIEEYGEILRANPNYPDAYIGRGLALATEDRYQEAIFNYQAAIDLKSEAPDLLSNLGIAYLKTGNVERAVEILYKAITNDPFNPKSRIGYGIVLMEVEKYDDAIAQFNEAARLDPTSADPLHQIGHAMLKRKDSKGAEEKYRAAIALDPEFAPARVSLALLLLDQQRREEAITFLQETIQHSPNSAEVAFLLAGSLADAGETERAIIEFRRALSLRDEWPEALNALAWILATDPNPILRNGFEAVSFAERANRLTNQNIPKYIDTLAAAYAEDGKFDDAVRAAKVAIGLAKQQGKLADIKEMEERLKLYEIGNPYHTSPPPSEGGK